MQCYRVLAFLIMHVIGYLSGSDRDGNRSPGSALRSLDLDGTEGAVPQSRYVVLRHDVLPIL